MKNNQKSFQLITPVVARANTTNIFHGILVIFCLLVSAPVIAQQTYYTVKGKVVDKNSKAPLQGASVFAQNTTFGVATDAEGNFTIKLPNGGYSLVVTYTGYETESLRISNNNAQNDNVTLEMAPQEKSLEEVSVAISNEVKNGWEKYGVFFTHNFIGQTKFANQTLIKNPEVLHFYFSKKRNRLKVMATEPVRVENFALGYVLKFAIDSFTYEYNTSTNLFVGYPLFEEIQGTPEQKEMWAKNRAIAYKGSMLQFMRSLYNQKLTDNGFELQYIVKNKDEETTIPLLNLYGALNYDKDDSTNTVEFKPNQNTVAVIYNKAKPEKAYLDFDQTANKDVQISTLIFAPDEPIVIEQNGYYFDQTDIITNGYLGFKKIGDMLPYDYSPE
ncbi:MAG: carboxypeptidase-like regulatory domain-containing protein [Ginsengibacter sp.]